MRAIIQRVSRASVTVDGKIVSSIGQGLCVLLGICRQDTEKDAEYITRKILNLRLFDDDSGKRWDKSVKDKHLEVLCVSQFTLHSILKGNKPDFHLSMAGDQSKPMFESCLKMLADGYREDKIKTGVFAAMMQVEIVNDGPVTITIDSEQTGSNTDEKKGKEKKLPKQAEVSTPIQDLDSKQSVPSAKLNEEDCISPSRTDTWRNRLEMCAKILGTSVDTTFESVVATLKALVQSEALLGTTPEEKALVNHWLHHGVNTFETLPVCEASLKDIDGYLTSRVFLVGYNLSLVDIFYFVCLHNQVSAMSFHEKQKLLNLTRWFSCLQDHFQEYLSDVIFTRSLLY